MRNWLLFAFLLLGISSQATSIVIYVSSEKIVAGADSKEVATRDGINFEFQEVPKFYESGRWLFCSSGETANENNSYYPIKIVGDYIKHLPMTDDLELEYLKHSLKSKILNELITRQHNNDYTFMRFGIFGYSKGVAFVRILSFYLQDANSYKIAVEDTTLRTGNSQTFGMLFFGSKRSIKPFLQNNQLQWEGPKIYSNIEMLIELEIQGNPNAVGGPIDILEVTGLGYSWIKRKPSCPLIL